VLRNSAQREQLGRDAKTYAATWAAQEMAVRLAELYSNTLDVHARSTLLPGANRAAT
jgi:hypothetical protein